MLEWRTAASMQSSAQGSIIDYYRQMWHAPVVAMLGLLFAALPGDKCLPVGIPFTVLWVLSPAVAWYVSQSAETEDGCSFPSTSPLSCARLPAALALLRDFRKPQENHLPPDNFRKRRSRSSLRAPRPPISACIFCQSFRRAVRLDQLCRYAGADRKHDPDRREDGKISWPSLQLVSHRHVADAWTALCFGGG